MSSDTIAGAIRVLTKIETTITEHERELDTLKQYKHDAEQRVIDAMIDDCVDKISVDGRSYKLDKTIQLSPETDMSDFVVKWIEQNGGADLTTPQMHWKRRNSFLNESFITDDGTVLIPAELVGAVKVYEAPRLKSVKA